MLLLQRAMLLQQRAVLRLQLLQRLAQAASTLPQLGCVAHTARQLLAL